MLFPAGDFQSPESRASGRPARHGITLVEVLISTIIIGLSVLGLVQFSTFNYKITTRTTDQSLAFAIARSAIEQVRQTGFTNTAEGTSTVYYDAYGTFPPSVSLLSSSVYTVTTTVTSDTFSGASPANDALRTVTVTVAQHATGQTIFTTATALARQGI